MNKQQSKKSVHDAMHEMMPENEQRSRKSVHDASSKLCHRDDTRSRFLELFRDVREAAKIRSSSYVNLCVSSTPSSKLVRSKFYAAK